jgi:hypothetical protein
MKTKKKNRFLSIVVGFLTMMLTIFSVQAMYGDSDSNLLPIRDVSPTGNWKSCVSYNTSGSFPFWKRVCSDCQVHFTNFNVRSTCWKPDL